MDERRKEAVSLAMAGEYQSEQFEPVTQTLKDVHQDKLPGDLHKVDKTSRIMFDHFRGNEPNREYKPSMSKPVNHSDMSNKDTKKHADIHMSKPTGVANQRPLSNLPPELRRRIFQHLLVFNEPIRVICKSKDPMKFAGFTRVPADRHGKVLVSFHNYLHTSGLEVFTFDSLLAIAATNRENCELAREVYYKDNRFVMPRDNFEPPGFLAKEWLTAIGPRARWYLADVTFEVVKMGKLPYTTADPDDTHEMLTRLGESASLHSLVIQRLEAYRLSPTCDMEKALNALFDYRGLKIFIIGNMPELEASSARSVTQPKDFMPLKELQAYIIGNREHRILEPLQDRTLRNYNMNVLQYLYVHTRSTANVRDHVSCKAMEKEFQERAAEAAAMCKKTLVDKLIERDATWMRGAQDPKDAQDTCSREPRTPNNSTTFQIRWL
ncbi:hypothetical protein Ptr902_10863 [Pyrenophora tritici-repentis]|nr:hypothetical protein Ptr902_10863 [Pyrenophora tritici-repentis]